MAKVTRWEEKLFNALKDPNESSGNEREIEDHMNYYYQRMDTQDLITAGTVSDIADGYQLLADLGLRGVFSVYCAKGKDFDQFAFKNDSTSYLRTSYLFSWSYGARPCPKILQKKKCKEVGCQAEEFQTPSCTFSNGKLKIFIVFITCADDVMYVGPTLPLLLLVLLVLHLDLPIHLTLKLLIFL